MTTPARASTCTGTFRDQHGAALTADLDSAAAAAAAGDWKDAAGGAARVQAGALHLHHSVARDALAGGLDWWGIGEVLAMHPQAAFEEYANLADGTTAPARQRPALAVTCTAGLASLHDLEPWHGIDIDDLDSGHSLSTDPTVARLRAAAKTLGEDIWIAVKLPGEFEGDDDLDDGTAIRRWTTVVLHPDELGWLREALALSDEGEDLDDKEDE
jgi:hypothetical protein